MQLYTTLKFGSFVAQLDPLKIFLNLFVQMPDTILTVNQNVHHTLLWESHKMQYPVQPPPEQQLAMKPNLSCLLLTLLLPPLIIWLVEMLIFLRKNPLFIFSCVLGSSL